MNKHAQRFVKPENATHRKYEALRAIFVEQVSVDDAARRFGYTVGTLRNLRTAFLKKPDCPFFLPDQRGRRKPKPGVDRDARIVELRMQRGLSASEIAATLKREDKIKVSATTVARVIKQAGLPKLWRRSFDERTRATRPYPAPMADRRQLDLSPRTIQTDFGGLFLFAPDLARIDIDDLAAACGLPGSERISAGEAMRSLLALKLWGIGRPTQVMAETLDQGIALFAGLNVIPKRATLTEYSCRFDPRIAPTMMDRWHAGVRGLEVDLGGGQSFDLDFHTIPYHGDDALIEKHYVSKRSRRQRGVLAFLARDADARTFAYANAGLRKSGQNDEVLRFVDAWRTRTGTLPAELVFDSRVTTFANLARLEDMGVAFITLRRRTQRMIAELHAEPPEAWRRITLTNVGRDYRNPRIIDSTVRIKDYPGDIRQIAIADLGHDKPTLLLTNQMNESAGKLVDRYARRMVIENTIADAIDFFHMDALSAAVPLRVDFDIQLTLMASSLYRVLGARAGNGMETAKPKSIFRNLVRASAKIRITEDEIIVRMGRRTNNPLLLAARYGEIEQKIPWLGNKTLKIRFP